MSARAARFREIDLTRALKAADKAQCGPVRIEIDPDGRMIITTGVTPTPARPANTFD